MSDKDKPRVAKDVVVRSVEAVCPACGCGCVQAGSFLIDVDWSESIRCIECDQLVRLPAWVYKH